MKKLALLLFILSIYQFTSQVSAQPCVPGNYSTSGIYPDSAIGLPTAYVNTAYNTVITVVVPTDTVLFGLTFAIDSIGVGSVTGFPAGFAYSTNPTNGYIHGGTSGCVLISGTPTLAQIGSYPITITLEDWVNHSSPALTDTHANYYKIVIANIVGIETVKDEVKEVFNYPNPFTKETTIQFNASDNENVTLNIYNSIGQLVYNEQIKTINGENIHHLKLAIEDGIYFYTIAGKDNFLHNKMIIKN